jgi:hypothetical protein
VACSEGGATGTWSVLLPWDPLCVWLRCEGRALMSLARAQQRKKHDSAKAGLRMGRGTARGRGVRRHCQTPQSGFGKADYHFPGSTGLAPPVGTILPQLLEHKNEMKYA